MEEILKQILQRLDQIESGQQSLVASQQSLVGSQQEIKTELSAIKEIVSNNLIENRSYTKQIETTQKQQQRVIEMLSSETIKTRADMRYLENEIDSINERLPKI